MVYLRYSFQLYILGCYHVSAGFHLVPKEEQPIHPDQDKSSCLVVLWPFPLLTTSGSLHSYTQWQHEGKHTRQPVNVYGKSFTIQHCYPIFCSTTGGCVRGLFQMWAGLRESAVLINLGTSDRGLVVPRSMNCGPGHLPIAVNRSYQWKDSLPTSCAHTHFMNGTCT